MKIGIVGCGLNSDYHVRFAKTYPQADIIGLVDRDEVKATAAAQKYGVEKTFRSIKELVAAGRPDVIHILTPPTTHYLLAKEAIESGCHVLVEKPLALNAEEARALYNLADRHGVMLCAMHNHFFDPCMQKAHDLIRSGRLGEVIHVDSHYGLNTRIPAFRDYPSPNVLPWLYELPGGVFHDFMPHPLYVLLEYTGKPRQVKAVNRSCGVLPHGLSDELRLLVDGERAFGTLTFSFAALPHLHFIRIHGTKMVIEVDFNTMTTVVHPNSPLPKAVQKVIYNISDGWQRFQSTVSNVVQFVSGKLKPYQGMEVLIHRFYKAIEQNQLPPVSQEQALAVIETMDEIWKQVKIEPFDFSPIVPEHPPYPVKHTGKVLVTGGSGFLGRKLIELLIAEGYPVRALVRKLSDAEPLKKLGVEIFWGDVADKKSLEEAFCGVHVVVHAAAGTSGTVQDCERGTIQGTQNILALSETMKIRKLVYISSCSVYGVADYRNNQLVTEESALERFPERRGSYSASKQQAEQLVAQAIEKKKFPIVILRPGTIFGPGGQLFTPMLGFDLMGKAFVVIGNGKFVLPFAYVDNVAEAVIESIRNKNADNQTFNVIDQERIDKKEYMRQVIRAVHPTARFIYFPYGLLYLVVWSQEFLFKKMGRNPILTRYRLTSSQKPIIYDNSKIRTVLGWKPRVSMSEAVDRMVRFENDRR
jgi:2-alkyl-3-oxoalkanoate reductase